MSTCKNCAAEVTFRVIGGRTVPLGCRCDPNRMFYYSREERTGRAWCPRCNRECFFVEHNGGCVWLDALGSPWPKHPCFDRERESADCDSKIRQAKPVFAGKTVDSIGRIINANLKCDLGQRFLMASFPSVVREFYVSPAFWEAEHPPREGDSIGYRFGQSVIVRADGVLFNCWSVTLHLCGRCGKRFLNWNGHRDLCSAHKKGVG